MSFENHLLKQIIDLVGGRIQIGVDLVQDDFLFLGQLVLGEGGMEGDVGKEVEAALVMLLEEGGLQAGLLLGGKSIEVAAYVVEATQDMVCLAVLRAFEDGVLHKVGEAVFVGQLIARAGLHHQYQMGDFALFFLVYQPNAIREDGLFVFVFQHGVKIGLQRYDKPKTFLTLHL